jgi:hypothetical protein
MSNADLTPSYTYDYTTGEMLSIDDCPPPGLAAWIYCPSITSDGQAYVDLRTVPNDVLLALLDEACANGDAELAETISGLVG